MALKMLRKPETLFSSFLENKSYSKHQHNHDIINFGCMPDYSYFYNIKACKRSMFKPELVGLV